MVELNGEVVNAKHFPDGTINFKLSDDCLYEIRTESYEFPNRISWHYENDSEMFVVYSIVNMIRDIFSDAKIELFLPYLPNARMDRTKGNGEIFTLKYFAKFINSLNFNDVMIYDIHSNVGNALIDRLTEFYPYDEVTNVIKTNNINTLYFPDEGSVKRYADKFDTPFVFGMKKRDWETGQILGLDVLGDTELIKGKDILIVDDICSRGGTFYHSAKKLKELGANKIYLFVTHCENTILEGDLLTSGLIEKVYTTNSIFTKKHEKIEVFEI